MSEILSWFTRAEFKPGSMYVDDQSDVTLEYVGCRSAVAVRGLVPMPEVIEGADDEPVMLFLRIAAPADGYWTCTRRDAELGATFAALADRVRRDAGHTASSP